MGVIFITSKKITIKNIVFVYYRNTLRVAKIEGNITTKNLFYIIVSKQNKLFIQLSDCYL